MSFSFKATLLLLACFCLINAMDHHHGATCNHDQHQKENPAGFVDIKEDFSNLESGRILASTDYPNIRIHANYDYLQKTAPTSYYNYIKNVLAPAVISYYQSALKIKYPVDGKLVLTSSVKTLCSLNTPSELYSGVDADYAILFNSRSESSSILATSYNCQLASGSKRPLIASTNFNRAMLTEPEAGDVLTHEKNTYLLLHEMMHTFGFSSSLYKYFVDASGKTLSGHIKSVSINGNSHTVVDVPALTDKLRNFHGCSSLPGAIMGIGDDSHWDKKLYLYETMQSGTIDGKRISEFGLGLLEASGWYVVDYDYAEPYFYGQGQGCDFINGACSSSKVAFDEFCIASGRGCNYMGNTGASCGSGSNMENCKYYIPSRDHHCEASENLGNARLSSVESYGRDIGSKCFTGTLYTKSSSSVYAYCLKYNCVGDGMNTQLQLILGSKTATCTKEGTVTVAGYYGSINCPDPLTFCNTVGKKYCPRNCMGRGTCVNNQCQCGSGFTGIDCALVA